MPLVHHELCFGCGRSNLFGLLMDVERTGQAEVEGRWFVKQDHQGPVAGRAHPGVVACALLEAIMLAGSEAPGPARLEFELEPDASPVVGSFCEVEASVGGRRDDRPLARATIYVDGRAVARLTGSFVNGSAGKESG